VSLAAREEMAALYLLTNLSAPAARIWSLEQPDELRRQPLMAAALQLAAAAAENNYVRFNRLLYNSRIGHPYRLAVRRTADQLTARCLRVMSAAYSSPACRYPLDNLAGLLRVEGKILRELCAACDIKIVGEDPAGSSLIQFNKSSLSTITEDRLVHLASGVAFSAVLCNAEWRKFLLGETEEKT
jgi:SAC3/GANP family